MNISWNPDKALFNFNKQGVRFFEAESVLYDPLALTIECMGYAGEPRFVLLGTDLLGRIHIVIYTFESNPIQLISARKAEMNENRNYEEGIRFAAEANEML